MINVEIAQDKDKHVWQQYLTKTGQSHHALAWEWRGIIHRTFAHTPYYLIAFSNNDNASKCVGIVPLFFVQSFLFGKAIISVPYINGGGIVADDDEAQNAILEKVSDIAKQHDVNYVELRGREKINLPQDHYTERTHKIAMVLKLTSDPEAVFNSFPAKLRSQIKRPTKSGMYANVAQAGDAHAIDSFYKVFANNMRDLGTPVYPKRLFTETCRNFGPAAKLITVCYNRTPVAAGITLGLGNAVEIPWASALRKYNRFAPNMLLYWEAIKAASEDGYSSFDFGRSSLDSGTFRFKKQWGAKPHQLHWYYNIRKGEMPDVNPKSNKFSMLVNTWKHLPVALTRIIGPRITRSLP